MTERKTIEIWLAVNELGEFRISWDGAADALGELKDSDGADAVRVVALNVTIDLPEVETIAVDVTVPPETKSPVQVSVG